MKRVVTSLFLAVSAAAQDAPPWDPVTAYETREVEGWTVRVNRRLLAQDALAGKVLRVLGNQLFRIARVVPERPLSKLRRVPIWVELEDRTRHVKCMCYHPSRAWLRKNGFNPEKARSVELGNARNFLSWTHDQPWMLLHELAHAYHHRVLGYDQPEILACFERATRSGTYDEVLRIQGREDRHYAMTNVKEYFAEGTEALFGTNDFYPFVRAELARHDPALYRTLRRLWQVSTERGR